MTAGYIGSKGKKFSLALKKQKILTKKKYDEFKDIYDSISLSAYPKAYTSEVKKVISLYNGLSDIRKKVISNNISVGEAIAYYTKVNKTMLESVAQTISIAKGGFCVRNLNAFYAFLMAKERAGIERAILSNTFAMNHFATNMKEKLVRIVSEQNSFLATFKANALPDILEYYLKASKKDAYQEVEQMRQVALSSNDIGGFGVVAASWFKVMSIKINALKEIEAEIEKNILSKLENLENKAYSNLILNLIISVILIVFILAIGAYLANDIVSRLFRLQKASADLSVGKVLI